MRLSRTWCVIVGLAAITGCSRQQPAPCEPEARYSTARSAQPVQIPDDLSPPDESDAIRLPADVAPVASITAGECLETPPPFAGDTRPFLNLEEEESRKSRREARREAKREARAAEVAPAAQPDPAPAEQRDPAPSDADRTIGN